MDMNIIMPQLGESIAEGKITVWLKEEGDAVERDESIVEVETDKATVEVPAPASGVLKKVLVNPEETVEVGAPIAVLTVEKTEGEVAMEMPKAPARTAGMTLPRKTAPESAPKAEKSPAKSPGKKPAPPRKETAASLPAKVKKGPLPLTPIVRRLIRTHGLDPSAIEGTGTNGRITREDVLHYIEEHKVEPIPPGDSGSSGGSVEGGAGEKKVKAPQAGEDDEVVPLDPIRKRIAERLVRSKHTAPHVTTVAKVDMTNVVNLRKKNKAAYEKDGVKLTYMPFMLRATAAALRAFPNVNASWGEDSLILHKRIHLGVAVSLEERGLVVPVIRDADRLSIREFAEKLQDLAARARKKKLSVQEIQGSTFTVTNPGVFGAVLSTPIINQPEAAILAIECIEQMPVIRDGGIDIRHMMNLCLSYDHRIVDGETAIKFLQRIRQVLEEAKFDLG